MQRAQPPRCRSFHVLLVGTDEETERRIRNQLSHSFYRITTHRTFNEAVGFFATEGFDVDLVLSSLEDEDGYNFISQIQLLRRNIPHVVIFGAERLVHDITRAYKLGACYILRKPVSEKSDEIENLWKHAFRWRAQNEDLWQDVFRWRVQKERSSSLVSSQQESLKVGYEFVNHGEELSLRKERMVWDEFLDALFVKVVNYLGKDAVPKQILEVMIQRKPELSLTREQVGSHLQKHRGKEKKKEQHQRRMNVMTVNQTPLRSDIRNHILARPLVSSSSRRDMSHLHLPETSTTNSLLPPPSLPQMQRHHYNQPLACQPQIQYEHHEQPLCQPMQFNNFGAFTSPTGNGSSNLISEHQPDSHVNTTRPAMQQPDRITFSESNMPQQRQPQGPSFEGIGSNMLQQQHFAIGTSFENSNMEQQLGQNLTSSTQQLGQTSSALYAPIRSDHDEMITTEATNVDEFADFLNQRFDDGLDCLDDFDFFPNHGAFLDACQEKEAPFQEKNETEPSQPPNK